tara:strand:- start:15517 stop:16215 length:699 start_codon:yes stop_codon:yes gene_type:complete
LKNLGSLVGAENNSEWIDLAVNFLITRIETGTSKKDKFNIALSGGNSPKAIFQKINSDYSKSINWEKVNFFWIDERWVPKESEESNSGNAIRILKDISANFYQMQTESDNPKISAKNYELLIKEKIESKNGVPVFDLVLLGMGEDGHIASLFPETDAIQETQHLVVSNYVPKLSEDRLTVTFPVLKSALETLIIIKGEKKVDILKGIISENIGLPISSFFENNNNKKTWIYI